MVSMFFLFSLLSWIFMDYNPDPEAGFAAELDSLACTSENKTYTIDIKVHCEKLVVDSIHSVALSIFPDQSEEESINAYFGTIFDEINNYLIRFKIQLHLKLDSYHTSDFLGIDFFDKSCEKVSPVEERTMISFANLKDRYGDNMGLHLFVWGCPFISNAHKLIKVERNKRCGRSMGLMWKGTQETSSLIKNTILMALTDTEGSGLENSPAYDAVLGAKICSFVTACVGLDKTEIGEMVTGTQITSYTGDPIESDIGSEANT